MYSQQLRTPGRIATTVVEANGDPHITMHTVHKGAFQSAANNQIAASFVFNAIYLSVWLHLVPLSPDDSVSMQKKKKKVMDPQFGEPLNQRYLDKSL